MKLIEVIASTQSLEPLHLKAPFLKIEEILWDPPQKNGRRSVRLLVKDGASQEVLDALHGFLGPDGHIILIEPETVLPKDIPSEAEKKEMKKGRQTREELHEEVEKGARLNTNYLLLVSLSTIVAAIGLIADNIAVVVGAMVIAPLLGPNLALALSTALGDTKLLWNAFKSNLVGLGLAILISTLLAYLWPITIHSSELLARTDVGLDGVALAFASGAAAALSLTTGLSSVLVGVMVAVALLPPAATMGIMIGKAEFDMAIGAGLLLAVNIVCVNLSAMLVFYAKGIKPRTLLQMEKARESSLVSLIFWILSLTFLLTIIILRHRELFFP